MPRLGFDLVFNPTTILAILGLIWALIKMGNKTQSEELIKKNLKEYSEKVDASFSTLLAADKDHQKEDDDRFGSISDKLGDIRESIAVAVEASRRLDKLEERVASIDGRMREVIRAQETELDYNAGFRHYVRDCMEVIIIPTAILCEKNGLPIPKIPNQDEEIQKAIKTRQRIS